MTESTARPKKSAALAAGAHAGAAQLRGRLCRQLHVSGLFGLFAAQVTGSFVIAGAEFITSDYGIAGKLLAIVTFLAAAAATTALVSLGARGGPRGTAWMLALEAVLLAIFAAMMLFGPAISDARDWHGIVAGLFAASAMGTQSVLVRLLMKGIPQTNVMTGNMTQLGIAMTDCSWRGGASRDSRTATRRTARCPRVRDQLLIVLSIAVGFLVGAAVGAVAFATTGSRGALLAVAIVVALALWALVRERQGEGYCFCPPPARASAWWGGELEYVARKISRLPRTRPRRPPALIAVATADLRRRISCGRSGARLCALLRCTRCLSICVNALRWRALSGARISRCVGRHRGRDIADETPARRGDVERLGAPVVRAVDAIDQLLALQAADHAADRACDQRR